MITILSGAFAPSIALLSFIYLKDKYQLEPLKLIIKMFILGSLLVFPAYVLERMVSQGLETTFLYQYTISIGIIEEFLKWFSLYFMIFKHVEFDEPYDGVVYSVAVAVGFATIENIGYLIFLSSEPLIILLRALLPVSSHAIFGILMGYFLGLAKFNNPKKINYLILSLFIPSLSHIFYNFILYQHFTQWFYIMIPFLIVIWIYGLNKMRVASKLSPFRNNNL